MSLDTKPFRSVLPDTQWVDIGVHVDLINFQYYDLRPTDHTDQLAFVVLSVVFAR